MTESNSGDSLIAGYEYSERTKTWGRTSEETTINIPEFGEGKYSSLHEFGNGTPFTRLTDCFASTEDRDNAKLFYRQISPYPYTEYTRVELRLFSSGEAEPFNELNFEGAGYKPNETRTFPLLVVGKWGAFRATYDSDGKLTVLNFGGVDGPFASYHFRTRKISDSEDKHLGAVRDYLNTGKPLLFNEQYQFLTQTGRETVAQLTSITGRQILRTSVPTSISMPNLTEILAQEGPEWLRILEHIPIRTTFGKEKEVTD